MLRTALAEIILVILLFSGNILAGPVTYGPSIPWMLLADGRDLFDLGKNLLPDEFHLSNGTLAGAVNVGQLAKKLEQPENYNRASEYQADFDRLQNLATPLLEIFQRKCAVQYTQFRSTSSPLESQRSRHTMIIPNYSPPSDTIKQNRGEFSICDSYAIWLRDHINVSPTKMAKRISRLTSSEFSLKTEREGDCDTLAYRDAVVERLFPTMLSTREASREICSNSHFITWATAIRDEAIKRLTTSIPIDEGFIGLFEKIYKKGWSAPRGLDRFSHKLWVG
jgi:hypothetical protein